MKGIGNSKSSAAFLGPIVGLLVFASSLAQTEVETSTVHRLHSRTLNEERVVSVFLPGSYAGTDGRYPVLVVLDGEDFARPIAGMVSYYSKIGACPEMIVVGIDAKDRWRDYTPTNAPIPDGTPVPTSGGAKSFTKFLETECLPYLEANYRMSPFRVLFGHSVAGLLVVSDALEEESYFSGFIATSPSLWWDRESMSAKLAGYAGSDPSRPRYLYLTMGNEGPTMLDPVSRFGEALEAKPRAWLHWTFRRFDDVDHQTMPIKAFAYGLEFVFDDWRMPQDLYEKGLPAIVKYYETLSNKYLQTIPPPERTINRLGYIAMNRGETDEALRIFRFNAELYPRSANVYDSLGEACLKAGDEQGALASYRKALELDPGNDRARDIVKGLESKR